MDASNPKLLDAFIRRGWLIQTPDGYQLSNTCWGKDAEMVTDALIAEDMIVTMEESK